MYIQGKYNQKNYEQEGLYKSQITTIKMQKEKIIELQKNKIKIAQKEAEKRKQFTIHFAHDVMAPLTSLLCEINNFMHTRNENDFTLVRTHVSRLIEMVGSFIDHEKIEKGSMIYKHTDYFNLSSYLMSKIKLSPGLFKSKNIKVQTDIGDDIFIKINKHALDRIINNAIDNAVKYNKKNGTIHVILKKDKEVHLIIKDTGIGMSEKQLDNLFLPYYKSISTSGMGEGMWIIKEILGEVFGTINVESIQNVGTAVKMTFREANLKNAKKIIVDSNSPIVLLHNPDVKIKERPFNKSKKSILIIEDDRELLSLMYNKISEEFNVFYAHDGKEALALLNNSLIPLPVIIVSDIMMENIDGHELYKRIRSNDTLKDLPVIFITAKRDEKDKIESYKKGILDYIQKPFSIEELLLRIKALLYTITLERQQAYIEMMYNQKEQIMRDPKNDNFLCWYLTCEKYGFKTREREITRYYLDGYLVKEIAEKCNISFNTVRSHLKNIYAKCKINNRAELNTLFRFYDREVKKILLTDCKNEKAIEEVLEKDWRACLTGSLY